MPRLLPLPKWYESLTPEQRTVSQNLVIWSVTGLCIWWVIRGVSFAQFSKVMASGAIKSFIAVNVVAFFLWWLADTWLFAVLFSFFHRRTTIRELVPATMAQYFLQAINLLAADGALIVFLNRRKGVRWLTATWTMMFQGLIDAITLSGAIMLAGLLVPQSGIRVALPYSSAAFGFFVCVSLWWAWGNPKTRFGRWLYTRPSAQAFRQAGLYEYLALGSIRLLMMTVQGLLFYFSVIAFAPEVPPLAIAALTPAMLAASSEPITPAGLGPLQAVVVGGLSRFAPRQEILTAALGISMINLLCRLPFGLGAAGNFARLVIGLDNREARGQKR